MHAVLLKAVTNRPEKFNRLKLTITFLSLNRRVVAKCRELYDNEILGRINIDKLIVNTDSRVFPFITIH